MKSKTPNTETNYAWAQARALCSEAELEGEDAKVVTALIAKMHLDPKASARIDPPPGYEDRLVDSLLSKALRLRSGAETPKLMSPAADVGAERAWFLLASRLIPATVFSFVLVAGFAIFKFATRSDTSKPENDLWAVAVENASPVEVSRWIVSVSGADLSNVTTSSDLSILSGELSERALKRVLKESGGS